MKIPVAYYLNNLRHNLHTEYHTVILDKCKTEPVCYKNTFAIIEVDFYYYLSWSRIIVTRIMATTYMDFNLLFI